ncbi:hypothetical protein [uncultured Cohaesibacter sp.]|uniref:hypothetical protein n=1 Tax=uncultured Cohaesibacter sp. TaxID=1002546 RepID=UPI00292F0CE9|nr:hypothetical protein [uncultured Cohaesibacter sp.]
MRIAFASLFILISSQVFAADSCACPFSFLVEKVETSKIDPDYSRVLLSVKNGTSYVRTISFQCQLENKDGFTWSGEGNARNLKPREVRKVTIVAENSDQYRNPISARCAVGSFDSGHVTFE